MPAWRVQNEVDFKREGTRGHITRVSLHQSITFEPPGEINIPRGGWKIVFAISAYIHVGGRHSIAEIEESGEIQCSAICVNGH
jgi:hypothetical protein